MARGRKKENLTPEERLQAALVPESEQPYKVPENWCWTRIGTILQLQAGKNIKASAISKIKNNETPFPCFGGNGIRGYVTDYNRDGDFPIIGRQGALCGNLNWASQKFYATEHAVVVECLPNISNRWAYYILHWMNLNQYATATAQPGLSVAVINQVPIALPAFKEQQRIVDRIESLFAKLDEAKQKAQDALDSFEPRKAAILHKAFAGELTARWRKEHGVGIESWKEKTSTQLFEYVTSGSRGWAKYYSQDGDPFIRMGNLDHGTIELDLTDIQYVSLPSKAEGQRTKLQKNDILISITADIGMIGLVRQVEKDSYINQHIALARPAGDNNAEFIAWYLVSDVGLQQLQNKQRGATKIGLGLDDIRSLKLLMPILGEQTEIVRILDDLLAKEQQAKEAAEKVLEQIDLIKKSILARAFRGELGTNDPSEESAVELLKQVL